MNELEVIDELVDIFLLMPVAVSIAEGGIAARLRIGNPHRFWVVRRVLEAKLLAVVDFAGIETLEPELPVISNASFIETYSR